MGKPGNISFLKSELIALIFSAACAAVFVFISCSIAVGTKNPESSAIIGATLSLMLTAFCGGFSVSRLHGKNGLICGAVFGTAALAVIFTIGIIAKIEISVPFAAISAPSFAIIAVLGGIAGAGNTKSGKRKKTHHIKR